MCGWVVWCRVGWIGSGTRAQTPRTGIDRLIVRSIKRPRRRPQHSASCHTWWIPNKRVVGAILMTVTNGRLQNRAMGLSVGNGGSMRKWTSVATNSIDRSEAAGRSVCPRVWIWEGCGLFERTHRHLCFGPQRRRGESSAVLLGPPAATTTRSAEADESCPRDRSLLRTSHRIAASTLTQPHRGISCRLLVTCTIERINQTAVAPGSIPNAPSSEAPE